MGTTTYPLLAESSRRQNIAEIQALIERIGAASLDQCEGLYRELRQRAEEGLVIIEWLIDDRDHPEGEEGGNG